MDFETILVAMMNKEDKSDSKETDKTETNSDKKTHIDFTATVDGNGCKTSIHGASTPVELIAMCATIVTDLLRLLYKDCYLEDKDNFIRKTLECIYVTAGLCVEEMIRSRKDNESNGGKDEE